jgi:two-component system chemotaxis sensor kinase CheA
MNEVIREFLIETQENLAQLDLDLVTLEKDPTERETLSRVFRTLHTIKGTAGFLGLARLQNVAHAAENLLGRLREGELVFNADIASALLAVVDAVRQMLAAVENDGTDGAGDFSTLIQWLERLRTSAGDSPPSLTHVQMSPSPVPPPAADGASNRVLPASTNDSDAGQSGATYVAPPSPAAETSEVRVSAVSDSTIRVDVGLLDKLMTLVGELVLARNQVLQFSASQENTSFLGTVQRLNLLTTELQVGVMKTRMQPIGTLWSKFPRVVRDLAVACGKQARIVMEGAETELDKTILEAIRDPLTHLVRNAVDHGIEPPAERRARGKPAEGRLALNAFHEGGKVIIELTDDGAGINPQRVRARAIQARLVTVEQADRLSDRELMNLIFLPGFSTAEKVTQFSGRGVGMDVVRTNIEKIGGAVTIDSRPDRGTTIKMKIPLTLAIIPALTVTSSEDRYAIPQVSLLELVRLEGEQARRGIEQIHDAPVYRLRGSLLPLVYLDRLLHPELAVAAHADSVGAADEVHIVVLQADDRQFGLVVDAIHDTEEIVVKPLQKQLKGISVFAGATIMGDGRVALILDVLGLAQKGNVIAGIRERTLTEKPASVPEGSTDRQPLLLFATRAGNRMAIPLSLVARLEEFPRSALENVGPLDVVQYRDEILPLIDVARALRRWQRQGNNQRAVARRRGIRPPETTASDTIQVVVHASQGQRVGLVVDEILDIVEEPVVTRSAAHRPGVLFTAVVQGHVTEFLDVDSLLRSIDPIFLEQQQPVPAET